MDCKKTLLQKYGLPLTHLDFGYIADCNDAREMEKIVQILRSGEEGYYPDLTRCAEERLQALKPGSKLFRFEESVKGRESLAAEEWKPVYDWTNQIKTKDKKLSCLKEKNQSANNDFELDLPPIRKSGKIGNKSEEESVDTTKVENPSPRATKPVEHIGATDYRKWDKYDADVELLKMELAEERVIEEVERKNRLNLQKSSLVPKITEITKNESEHKKEVLERLTDVEREKLAEDYRLRGNEYFRTKEYENAIAEYSKAIEMNAATAAPSYNNRAIANIKLQKYEEAVTDCNKCLELDPKNGKAWLRKAQATYNCGRRREAYDIYHQILEDDQNNSAAFKAIEGLRNELGELPPLNATRLKIQEGSNQSETSTNENAIRMENPNKFNDLVRKTAEKLNPKPKEYDLADLIVPNRIVKNKLASTAAALSQTLGQKKPKSPGGAHVPTTQALKLPMSAINQYGNILIEEI